MNVLGVSRVALGLQRVVLAGPAPDWMEMQGVCNASAWGWISGTSTLPMKHRVSCTQPSLMFREQALADWHNCSLLATCRKLHAELKGCFLQFHLDAATILTYSRVTTT